MKKTFKLALAALVLASSTALIAVGKEAPEKSSREHKHKTKSRKVSKFLEELEKLRNEKYLSSDGALAKTADFLDAHPKIKLRLLIPIYRKRISTRNLICLQTRKLGVLLSPTQLFDEVTKKESFGTMIATNLYFNIFGHMEDAKADKLTESIESIADDIAQYISSVGQILTSIPDAEVCTRKITKATVHKRFGKLIARLLKLVDRENYYANDHVYNLIILLLDQWNYWYQTDFYDVNTYALDTPATRNDEQNEQEPAKQAPSMLTEIDQKLATLDEQKQKLLNRVAVLQSKYDKIVDHYMRKDGNLINATSALDAIHQERLDIEWAMEKLERERAAV